jgi:hypothetical protein
MERAAGDTEIVERFISVGAAIAKLFGQTTELFAPLVALVLERDL